MYSEDGDSSLGGGSVTGVHRNVGRSAASSSIYDTPAMGAAVPPNGVLNSIGSGSSFVMPSNPHDMKTLLDDLKMKFPSIDIPMELRRQSPQRSPLPMGCDQVERDILPPGAIHSHGISENDLSQLHMLYPPAATAVSRLESSVDLNSPPREMPMLPCELMPVVPSPSRQIVSEIPVGHIPFKEIDPNLVLSSKKPSQEVLSPKQSFYDKLGRQLTDLLLEAGTPLPRFPLNLDHGESADFVNMSSQTMTSGFAETENETPQKNEDAVLRRAKAAAEMFLTDYYNHKRALGEVEHKLDSSENENLALRSQLDLAMVKMIASQKELDRYSTYFNLSRSDGGGGAASESQQVKALLRKLQDMAVSLQKSEQEKLEQIQLEKQHIVDAVSQAVAERDHQLQNAKLQIREKKKIIKDMRLVLHSYLSTNDPTDVNPKMAFLDLLPHTNNQKSARIGPGVAL